MKIVFLDPLLPVSSFFDRKYKSHPMRVAATRQPRDVRGYTKQGNERGSEQKPVFGPSLPPDMARERRQVSEEADETMTGI
jgi:hypothetical protein